METVLMMFISVAQKINRVNYICKQKPGSQNQHRTFSNNTQILKTWLFYFLMPTKMETSIFLSDQEETMYHPVVVNFNTGFISMMAKEILRSIPGLSRITT